MHPVMLDIVSCEVAFENGHELLFGDPPFELPLSFTSMEQESPPDADQGSGPPQKQTLAERVEQDWKK